MGEGGGGGWGVVRLTGGGGGVVVGGGCSGLGAWVGVVGVGGGDPPYGKT